MNAETKRDSVPIPQSSRVDEFFRIGVVFVVAAMGCIFAYLGAWGLYGMYRFIIVTDLSWGIVEVAGLVFVATFFTACVIVPILLAIKLYRVWR